MKVVKQYLTAIVSKAEFDEGTGHEFPNLFVVAEDFTFYKRTKLAEGGHCLLSVKELPKTDDVSSVKEEISFLPGGKMPFEYLSQIISFFKKVMEINFGGATSRAGQDCEAMAHVLWNKVEKKYEIGIPIQKVGKASVSYEFNYIDQEKHVIILDIHSHNSMSAFFSGTDDADDKKGCWFAGVAGNLDKDPCMIKFRFTNFGNFREVKFDEIFEPHPETAFQLLISDEVPKEWLDKVQGRYTAPATFQGRRATHTPAGTQQALPYDPTWGGYFDDEAMGMSGIDRRLAWMYADMGDDDFPAYNPPGNRGPERGRHLGKSTRERTPWKSDRIDPTKDYYGRTQQDAVEAIGDLDYPVCASNLRTILNEVVERVKTGITTQGALSYNDTFFLEYAETFAEEFCELYQGEDLDTYQIPYIIALLQQKADWNNLNQIFEDLLDFMGTAYKDNAHMDMLVDYIENNEAALSIDNIHRLRTLLDEVPLDAQVQD